MSVLITEVYEKSRGIYGSPRIAQELKRRNQPISRSYVARLMKKLGLRSKTRKKFKVTTESKHGYETAQNLLQRDFSATGLSQKWVSDITYIKTGTGWLYLTTVIDLGDRKVIGWSFSKDMTVENTSVSAIKMAVSNRGVRQGLIFHSDRGVQYASKKMTNLLSFSENSIQSMSRKANCWDNAVAESFFKTIKYECLNRYEFKSYIQTYECINEYIKWYNTKTIHSTLGYLTPLEKEMELRKLINNVA